MKHRLIPQDDDRNDASFFCAWQDTSIKSRAGTVACPYEMLSQSRFAMGQLHRVTPTTPMFGLSVSIRAGGQGDPPLRGVCVVSLTFKTKQMDSAQCGGMLSGRAASRTGQLSDTASQHTFGGWQGGHRPRWQYTSPHFEIISAAIGDGRPTGPYHVTNQHSRTKHIPEFA